MKYDGLNQQFNLHFCRSQLIFPLHAAILKHTVPLTTEENIVHFQLFYLIFCLIKYAFFHLSVHLSSSAGGQQTVLDMVSVQQNWKY